ncbi:hypothetical protein H7X46_02720 [Pseudonocardia sp. C8]|uniref:hypothetical protein n=1 Tax=Pseudonocardia sp. C8 TaxID=2762759 RepID=UPI001642E020|nr:hypothetical protein [Pseudonocardia sp. C8]MBC3189975.1 hypothetical protein [Pseudonocardia sp. C8]
MSTGQTTNLWGSDAPVTEPATARSGRWSRAGLWLPGLAVAVGAAVATAHGLYEVAVAARVPAGIAWLYPLITDGLALVAYTATARLSGRAARYAWAVVIVAAGLSGVAQAVFLAGPAPVPGAPAVEAAAMLRFGVGAWPAIAAAVVAHLLYLLAADDHARRTTTPSSTVATPASSGGLVPAVAEVALRSREPVVSGRAGWDTGQPDRPALDTPGVPALSRPVSHPGPSQRPELSQPVPDGGGVGEAGAVAPAQDRARDTARAHQQRHGDLPTVRELQDLADVGRGTAARALQQLREQPQQATTGLHLVTTEQTTRTQT